MPTEVADRRATIAEAFETIEAEEFKTITEAPAPTEAPADPPATAPSGDSGLAEPGSKAAAPAPTEITPPPEPGETQYAIDKAPQSWRAPQRAQWDKLPADVRQEIMRRERDTTRVLGETAQARSFVNQYQQTIQPYQGRLAAMGINPMVAVQELLKADYLLATGGKSAKAQMIAKIVKDYDVDIRELDSALAGAAPADPVAATVEQMLRQQLAPFQQYIQNQEHQRQQQEQMTSAEISQSIEQMSADPKYPHFQELREDMADVIDLAAKRGVYLSLPEAYTRAVAMNPEVSKQVSAQQAAEAKKAADLAANAKAQRALGASVSVGGSPGGVPSGASGASDRRATIAAAFDSLSGR